MTNITATAASITDVASPMPARWLSSRAVCSDGVSSACFLLGVIRVLHAYTPSPLASGRAMDVSIERHHVCRETCQRPPGQTAVLQRIFPANFGERRAISEGYLHSCSIV